MSFFPQNKQKVVVLVAEQFLRKCIIADTTRVRAPWGFKVLFFFIIIIVSEVVRSHRSWVQCPANWFPFLTSESGEEAQTSHQ